MKEYQMNPPVTECYSACPKVDSHRREVVVSTRLIAMVIIWHIQRTDSCMVDSIDFNI